MGKLLKEFQETVPRKLLEENEPRITSTLDPTKEELEAISAVLNAVAIDFYLPKADVVNGGKWERLAAVNSAIEQGLRDFPKCLSIFKVWVVLTVGLPVLSEAGSDLLPDYQTARRLLYLDWYEAEADRMSQKG